MTSMRTDEDLERILRATLAADARSVADGPSWTAAPTGAARRGRRPWVAPLLAAAAVVALGAAALVLRSGDNPKPAPATHLPSPRISSPPAPAVTRTACIAGLPTAWAAAMRASTLPVQADSVYPVSTAPDGRIVAVRLLGGAYEVVLVAPATGRATSVYRVPDPQHLRVQDAVVWSHYAVISLAYNGGATPGFLVGTGGEPLVHRLLVVDLRTGHVHEIPGMTSIAAYMSGGRSVSGVAVQDGVVYWDDRPTFPADRGVLRAYDLNRGTSRVALTGNVRFPHETAAGVVLGYGPGTVLLPAPNLPGVVARASAGAGRVTLATDGTSWAWYPRSGVIAWWHPGLAAPEYVRITRPDSSGSVPNPAADPPILSGRFVDTGGYLVDMSTAVAVAPTAPRLFGGNLVGATTENGTELGGTPRELFGYGVASSLKEGADVILRLVPGDLPALHC